MKIEFFLPLEPFSVNAMYYRDKRHKTQAFRDWELRVMQALNSDDVQQKLHKLRTDFKQDRHCFAVEFCFQFPNLLNKAGDISSRCEDLSNVEKPLLDLLFLPKYHVQDFPYGVKNVNCDDKHVLSLKSTKVIGPSGIGIKIKLIPKPRPVEAN